MSLPAMIWQGRDLLQFCWRQRVAGFDPPTAPALDAEALGQFESLLSKSAGYLEFGCGGSTLLADKFGLRSLSVESDRFYARMIRGRLSRDTEVEFLEVRLGWTREWSKPVFTKATARRLQKWQNYSRQPFQRLDALGWFPDFVLVDGRFRRACILETARQAMRRGHDVTIMVDDYYAPDRSHYGQVEAWLGQPRRCGRAAIFQIPAHLSRTITEADVATAAADYR